MSATPSSACYLLSRSFTPSLLLLLAISGIATGCGSSPSSSTPKLTGNTNVTVLVSSKGNDQVTQFDMQLKGLTLTSHSGKTVTLLPSQQPSEFMHLNGSIEPLLTYSVPQDVYTSATLTQDGAVFVCISQDPTGGLLTSNYSLVNGGPTVNMTSPITITGDTMA